VPDSKASILIVEDEESVRTSLAEVFTYLGYRARSATDGLAALKGIREEVPDILLSDLNMPEMSGFELLSIIHRRFPAIYVIAMSGLFTENRIPSGVTADAFYTKGCGVSDLLKIVEARSLQTREHRDTPEPIWVEKNGHDASGGGFVTIACPECFRAFPQAINGTANLILDTSCVFCQSCIHYAIVEPRSLEFPQPWKPSSPEDRSIAPPH
jgi:CheY-like chemotaxis protein